MRFLLGPVSPSYASEHLPTAVAEGRCVSFDSAGLGPLDLAKHDSWESFQSAWPPDWQPRYLALYLAYRTIPEWIWRSTVPIVGLAADWNLLWHQYRAILDRCDLVVTDAPGVARFQAAGFDHVRPAILYGGRSSWLTPRGDAPCDETPRDIDVLFVGNLHPAVHGERLAWLTRLARFADSWNIVIRSGVFGDDYRRLLARSRVVFNRSLRGEWNMRVFETLASGALLLQESHNLEVPVRLRGNAECVYYDDRSFEGALTQCLEDEEWRRGIAERGCARAAEFTFEALWSDVERWLETDAEGIETRRRRRLKEPPSSRLGAQLWQRISGDEPRDSRLGDDAAAAVRANEADFVAHFVAAVTAIDRKPTPESLAQAVASFVHAALHQSAAPLSRLNRCELLAMAGRNEAALEGLDALLASLPDMVNETEADLPHVPTAFDEFRVAWEQAAWQNAGDAVGERRAKRGLIARRAWQLRGELSDSPQDRERAVACRSDLLEGLIQLGSALVRQDRSRDAIEPLAVAWARNPFRADVALQLWNAYRAARRLRDGRRLARTMRLLAKAMPSLAIDARLAADEPTGDELASVIVPCWNQVEYTRLCLDSLLRTTHTPFEIVAVDDGSTDGTHEFLQEFAAARHANPHLSRVAIVRNKTNTGFAAACNRGLREARGTYLVLLNNDTIVTQQWLERLIDWSLVGYPRVGLVGPATNNAPPPQLTPFDFQNLTSLEAFAADEHRRRADKAVLVERLTGFCLLIRRDVFDAVGPLDERFGHGFFEDDDWCARVRQRGLDLLFAGDVFIHHFGSRSITKLDIPPESLLRENHARFRAKWGDELANRYRLPDGATATSSPTTQAAPSSARPRLSLTMIVRNEESNLAACLESVAGLVDESIVVDTGSTDRTREIAAEHGAKVFEFPWIDDFAAARNEALRHATGEWIVWMDADDRLDAAARDALGRLIAELNDRSPMGFVMKCLCLPENGTGTTTVVDHIRLFRNHASLRWKYRIHEQILPSIRLVGGEVAWTEAVIHHTGYQDPDLKRRKRQRDLRLLELEDREHPDDPFTHFNLGQVFQEEGRFDDALARFRRSLDLSHPQDSIVRKLYSLIAQILRHQRKAAESLAVCRDAARHYPDDPELLFQEGLTQQDLKDWPAAESCYRRILNGSNAQFFSSSDPALRSYKAKHNLGVVLHEQGRTDDAEEQWRQAAREHFAPSLFALGDLYLHSRRWNFFEDIVQDIRRRDPNGMHAELLVGRRHLALKDFAAAQTIFQSLCRSHPAAVAPRELLSHVFLQSEQWREAEASLLAVLDLDPHHAEARRNLDTLRAQHFQNEARDGLDSHT